MIHLLLWSDDSALEATASKAVGASALLVEVARCVGEREARARLQSHSVDLVLVDLGSMPLARLRQVEPLVHAHPVTRFVVLCDAITEGLVLEAMQAGARSCIAKADLGTSLPGLVERLLGGGLPSGQAITVLSAKGGVGASTIALGLAAELLREGDEALLVDLDLAYGGLSRSLTRGASYGLGDVLERGEEVDMELIRSTALEVGDGLRLLLSPTAIALESSATMDLGALPTLIRSSRRVFATTVLDAPRLPIEHTALLCKATDVSLLVLQLSVVDLRSARAIRRGLIERGVTAESIVPVIDRYRRRGSVLTLQDAAAALDGVEPLIVSDDHEAASRSSDLGRPLKVVAPRSSATRDLKRIAETLTLRHLNPADRAA